MFSWIRVGALIVGALAGCNAITGVGDFEIGAASDGFFEAGARKPIEPVDDAGVLDETGSPIDGGVDAGRCPPFATFCDDFESGDLVKWTSLLQTNSGKVSVVGTKVFDGQNAFYALAGPSTPVNNTYPAVGAGARVTVPVVTSGLLVVRARVFMPRFLGDETTFIKAFAKNGVDDMNVKITNGGLVKVDTDIPDAGPELTGTKGPPIDKWFCIEWQATIGAAGHQRILVDGEEVLAADEYNLTSQGYDSVQIGFNAANGSVTQDIYFDDVVMATQPIGCN